MSAAARFLAEVDAMSGTKWSGLELVRTRPVVSTEVRRLALLEDASRFVKTATDDPWLLADVLVELRKVRPPITVPLSYRGPAEYDEKFAAEVNQVIWDIEDELALPFEPEEA